MITHFNGANVLNCSWCFHVKNTWSNIKLKKWSAKFYEKNWHKQCGIAIGYVMYGSEFDAATVKPRISEHAGDQMICSNMRIIRVFESVQENDYSNRGIPDFPVTRILVYGGPLLVIQVRNKGPKVRPMHALVIAINVSNSYESFGLSPWKKRVNTSPGLGRWLEICRHQNRFSSYFRNIIIRSTKKLGHDTSLTSHFKNGNPFKSLS